MSLELRASEEQSAGCDPKAKRNSGLFAFFKWFKASTSRESIDTPHSDEDSGSNASLNSIQSNGTVASFHFVRPQHYQVQNDQKTIHPGPETDTYRARLKQRDKRRESDKNITLRKKYNLFFNRETLLKTVKQSEEENTKSLPLMTKTMDEEKIHRRTNSESSKTKKAGAYLHAKGKRKAPQPPGLASSNPSTLTLRRNKKRAPEPPVLENDSLRLDNGILKATSKDEKTDKKNASIELKAPVSPKPWYKRNSSARTSIVETEVKVKKIEDTKRKSGISFLTNISELDREAGELMKKEKNAAEIPQFMRPKEETTEDTLAFPKRRSAKDLIAKFNAITSVTKATVFGVSTNQKRDYFGRRTSLDQPKQENLLESHKKKIEQIDRKVNPLAKSESTSAVLQKVEVTSPKIERKNWKCAKCGLENDYWRIICHVCSAIKPYFDDFSSGTREEPMKTKEEPLKTKEEPRPERLLGLERSKTQIGFSQLATYNQNSRKVLEKSISLDENNANPPSEDREKLKKMLIEMKNSLPGRKPNVLTKQNSRTSVIMETPDEKYEDFDLKEPEKKVEIVVATSETIYENIKVKKDNKEKPVKIASSAQTTSIFKQPEPMKTPDANKEPMKTADGHNGPMKTADGLNGPMKTPEANNEPIKTPEASNYEPMKATDFETIYNDANPETKSKIYANLARNDELSLFFNVPKNIAGMKHANLAQIENTSTIEVNRLLKRLESAIAKGELVEAANYAKELAQMKVNCSVIRQCKPGGTKKKGFNIEMYVEDKISHRGPFSLEVTENQTVAELKKQVQEEYDIPVAVQRWILGKELAINDQSTLKEHNITTERCPVFLYLVAPTEPKNDVEVASTSEIKPDKPKVVDVIPKIPDVVPSCSKTQEETTKTPTLAEEEEDFTKTLKPSEWECHLCTLLNPKSSNICAVCATVRLKKSADSIKNKRKSRAPQPTYQQLVNLDNKDLVENGEPFECLVCFCEIPPGHGVTLRECLHQFCKQCLAQTIQYGEEAQVKCPFRDEQYSCNIALQDREIKALVSVEVYDGYLARSVTQAENRIGKKSFHCKTPDCKGWCIFEDNVNEFRCPVCRKVNCLTCQAIHTGLNCKQYQEKMNLASEIDEDAKRTKAMVDEMVKNGEALNCPTCQVILMKKWGCDWVRCSMCKTEICWVTKGPRWGPAGKGDTSGGCQCGLNGVKCHPKCSYCH